MPRLRRCLSGLADGDERVLALLDPL